MPRSTVHFDLQSTSSMNLPLTVASKSSTRTKNDQKWDAYKHDIYRFYVEEDKTLDATIQMIEANSGFKASSRKWKMKLKEWRFEKNLSKHDMELIIAKALKRSREESKDTVFFH
ncbi:uncharacterized protein L3040_004723 [Drepanopeziza brunnea f. sp. 'multigermtubi']|uniref:Clr5 domain-containing protein n=1 Tax=Marssonina brunnea f. sp. multigermtubi (strain MB_m1) TaxID=1072389 RepID=K1WZA4_MARBU|nr:uncharacterized protein MBM_03314 [Drepanopeziza brunnea f. sp. 'multigermtubi' MB_m1]EKD18321.1 hypothetical protein MBM_03314 [Drepanopeziza brunnea f. sp. 'multigermtubi' MB_m1]KAJ5042166.1 hypothetical protein L3040_004723 [Drepanopeziza brunnea f. sp. 'multigermtubi']